MSKKEQSKKDRPETVLEFAKLDDGKIVLRDLKAPHRVHLTIDFSSEVQEILGADLELVGHHMVQAAIYAFMQKQMHRYHANVQDECPILPS